MRGVAGTCELARSVRRALSEIDQSEIKDAVETEAGVTWSRRAQRHRISHVPKAKATAVEGRGWIDG